MINMCDSFELFYSAHKSSNSYIADLSEDIFTCNRVSDRNKNFTGTKLQTHTYEKQH